MGKKTWTLLILIVVLIVLGGVFLFKKITLIQLGNLDHPKTITIKINPSEGFFISYIHSIYREPVSEEFQVEKDSIILIGVRTKSSAVMEYYGFEDMKEFHLLNKRLGAVFIMRRGMGEGQTVLIKDKKINLSEIGDRGDRILLRVETVSLGRYFLYKIIKGELWEKG